MADSIHKRIVDKIAALMREIDGKLTVELNTALPQEVPEDGLIIVRDIRAEPSEEMIGGFDTLYMTGVIPVEVFVQHGDAARRDTKYDEMLQAVSAQLLTRDDNGLRSLGGLIFGLVLDRPVVADETVYGAADVKAATINVRIEYQAPGALA